MGSGNGPYHWGNGPQPRRGSNRSGGGGHRGKSSGKASFGVTAMAWVLVFVPGLAIAFAVGYAVVAHA